MDTIEFLNTFMIGALSASVYFLAYQIRDVSRRLDILYEVTIDSDDEEEDDEEVDVELKDVTKEE